MSEDQVQFECVLTSKSIKIMSATLHCLAKLGKEVVLEANTSLMFRQVNDAKTSFISFEFKPAFFESFHVMIENGLTAKLKLKSCLTVFRSMKSIERLVLSFVNLGSVNHCVMFRAECKHQVTKTHQFYFEEAEALDPQFDQQSTQHRIRARPKLLIEALKHIHGTDEIEIQATAGIELKVTSQHHHSSTSNITAITTEMKIPKDDFEEYQISQPKTILCFSVKEFRALLAFCETTKVDISDVLLLFNEPGSPLMLTSVTNPDESTYLSSSILTNTQNNNTPAEVRAALFSFTLVLATIPEDPNAQQSQESEQAQLNY